MLANQIDTEIKSAMLSKNEAQLRGLRAIKAAFLLAKSEKGVAAPLTEEMELKILQKLVKQRKESAEIYQQQGRSDLYQIEQEEIEVIEKYLPTQLSKESIIQEVKIAIEETGAQGMKDMGKVMGMVNKKLAGKADGRLISEVVKTLLSVV